MEPGNREESQFDLHMAKLSYADLVYADSKSWGYWKCMEIDGYHALISLYTDNGDIETGGTAETNKLLWALGNYSLFIRPDYKRINIEGADDLDSFVASGYISPDGKTIIIVGVNSSYDQQPVKFNFPKGVRKRISGVQAFKTDKEDNLKIQHTSDKVRLLTKFNAEPRSVTTWCFRLSKPITYNDVNVLPLLDADL